MPPSPISARRAGAAIRRRCGGSASAPACKVVCAAGYYWDPFPDIALASSVEEIRDAMIAEIESGTDGTDVRCGVIKVGTAQEPNEPAERLFKAAAAGVARDRRAGDHAHVEHRARRPGTSACWKAPAWT